MINRAKIKNTQMKMGFTLTEAMIAVVILMILFAMVGPSFRVMVENYAHREETSGVEFVVRRTLAEGIGQGTATRISIVDNTIFGEISTDRTGINFDPIANMSYTLSDTSFVRNNSEPTPWLGNVQTASLAFEDPAAAPGMLQFSQFGLPERGGAIFIQKDEVITGVIEIMVSGDIRVYRWEGGEWTR